MSSDSESGTGGGTVSAAIGTASGSGSATSRKRQISVPDMVRRVEQRRSGQQRVRHQASPRAAEGQGSPGESVTLAAIERLIEIGTGKVITALEARFERFERRLEVLETECFEKDIVISKLKGEVETLRKDNVELREQIEGIDTNRRMSSLILTCDDFGARSQDEDIERMAVQVLNQRFTGLGLDVGDIQAAHRLQSNNKVIVRFMKRRMRDVIFERRFELFARSGNSRPGLGQSGEAGRRRMAPLYLAESLTPRMQRLYQGLLAARRQENGAKVVTVFSRRGYVYCKMEKGGSNIRIRDEDHMRRLLGGALPALPGRGAASAAADRAGRGEPAVSAGHQSGAALATPDGAAHAGAALGDAAALGAPAVSGGPDGGGALLPAGAAGDVGGAVGRRHGEADDDGGLAVVPGGGTGLVVDTGSASDQNAGKRQPTAASAPPRLESVSDRGRRRRGATGAPSRSASAGDDPGLSGSGRLIGGPWR